MKNLSDYVSLIESLTKPIRRVIWDLNGYLNSKRCQFSKGLAWWNIGFCMNYEEEDDISYEKCEQKLKG